MVRFIQKNQEIKSWCSGVSGIVLSESEIDASTDGSHQSQTREKQQAKLPPEEVEILHSPGGPSTPSPSSYKTDAGTVGRPQAKGFGILIDTSL